MSALLERTVSGIPEHVWDAFCKNCARVRGNPKPDDMKAEALDREGHYFLARLIQHIYDYQLDTLRELTQLIYMTPEDCGSIHITDIPQDEAQALHEKMVGLGYTDTIHYIQLLLRSAYNERHPEAPRPIQRVDNRTEGQAATNGSEGSSPN